MTLTFDTLQIIILIIVLSLGIMSLSNTKKPVENGFYDDKYDQTQFDNVGCRWVLIFMAIGGVGVLYFFYWFFNNIGK